MRLLATTIILVSCCTNLWGQRDPLEDLTVATTRFGSQSVFADVTYGYKRGPTKPSETKLQFVVIQTSDRNSGFKTKFHLSSKVDDVTPPAYLAIGDGVTDLPDDNQVHAFNFSNGRHERADSDITLAEIRDWLDQPKVKPTIESLLDYRAKSRFAH